MAKRGQRDDVWEAVQQAWYPGGVPARKNSPVRTEVNGAVEDLRGQGATGEQIALWVANCKAAIKKDTWPESGCSLHTCVTKFAQFRPDARQIIEHRFDKWKAGLPEEWQMYVGMLMHEDMARQCWVDAAGRAGEFTGSLHRPAQKEWERLNKDNQHHTELRNGKVVRLLDEMNTVLAPYLPGGSE